jgi:nucleotide-binding universal stress UspA family protein
MWPPKKILCPTDFSEGSTAAISQASQLVKEFGAEIYLIHVTPIQNALPTDPAYSLNVLEFTQLLQEQATKHLEDNAQKLQAVGITARAIVAIGDAASAIVETAEHEQVDLIVIATYGKTGWRRLAFGSVTEKVVRLATCPVLTIRRKPE